MNQLTAGAFVGTFVYCLLVLRTIRSSERDGGDAEFVPALAVTTGGWASSMSRVAAALSAPPASLARNVTVRGTSAGVASVF